jgi:hypothetical protein
VRAVATAGTAAAITRATASALVTTLPVAELWRDFHSTIVSGGDLDFAAGDTVDGGNAGPPQPWTAADCPPPSPAGAWLGGTARPGIATGTATSVTSSTATILGVPPLLRGAPRTTPPDFDRIGSVDAADFAAIADRIETGTITLASATRAGTCDERAPGNWGEPIVAAHACRDFAPLVYAPANLSIAGGAGQGILIVDGDLDLAAGVRFYGAILVRGHVSSNGARVYGSVRIASATAASVLHGTFRYSDCALDRAFRQAPALRTIYRFSDRWWLPPF